MTDPQQALVTAARTGDRAAFEQLVRQTARLVLARAYLETGDVHKAEDVTQETFLIAWRRIGQLKDASGFRPWLLQIAHNAAIDLSRRNSRKKRAAPFTLAADHGGDATNTAADPHESAERQEQRERALAELRQLPEEYRQPLMLRYLAGADYETISRQLALSNGSLRGLLHRGLELLRNRLDKRT